MQIDAILWKILSKAPLETKLHKRGCNRILQLMTNPTLVANAMVQLTYRSSPSLEHSRDGFATARHCVLSAISVLIAIVERPTSPFYSQPPLNKTMLPCLYCITWLLLLLLLLLMLMNTVVALTYCQIRMSSFLESVLIKTFSVLFRAMSTNGTPRNSSCALLFLNTKQAVANDATTTTTTTTSARARMLLLTENMNECRAHIVVDPTVLDDFMLLLTENMNECKARIVVDPTVLDDLRHVKIPWNHTHDDPSSAGASSLLFEDTTPLEFQCLLQDLFVLTPKVNDLLFEDDDDDEWYIHNNDNEE
jgi:hypothetical protein